MPLILKDLLLESELLIECKENFKKKCRNILQNQKYGPLKLIPPTCNDPLGLIWFHVAIVLTGNWSEIGFWSVIQTCIEGVRVIGVTSQWSRRQYLKDKIHKNENLKEMSSSEPNIWII